MYMANRNILKRVAFSLFFLFGGTVIYLGATNWLIPPHTKYIESSLPAEIEKTQMAAPKESMPAGASETATASKMLYNDKVVATPEVLLNLALRGTVNWGEVNAQAIIEDLNERKQQLYKIGDVIRTGIIKNIMRESVTIRLNGNDITLLMASTMPVSEEGTHLPMTVKRSEFEKMKADAKNLMSQISFSPHVPENGAGGLKINEIAPGSIFDKLGFTKGDIIVGINGAKIQRPRMLAAIYSGAKLLPKDVLSPDGLGSTAGSVVLNINGRAGGIAHEVSKVYKKMESGEDIPIRFTRNGNSQTTTFRVGD
jgi:type II secretion system protein C